MDTSVNFKEIGFDDNVNEFLNWCLKHRDNLEFIRDKEVMEIWEQKKEEGNAVLNFNNNGVLLRINKNLFS